MFIVENEGADEFRVIHLRGEWVRARKRLANHSAREKENLSASQIKRSIRKLWIVSVWVF